MDIHLKQYLQKVQEVYAQGGNIIETLKKELGAASNNLDLIAVSYDFQTGSYIQDLHARPDYYEAYTSALAKTLDLYMTDSSNSIVEVGVGEGITLGNVIPKLAFKPRNVFGFDISWSRTRLAREYLKAKGIDASGIVMADLFNCPFADNSMDVVYTTHSLEPNGGREKEALQELYRITRGYLVLLEPAYDLASDEGRKRMESHGYVTNLLGAAQELGYEIIEHRLFERTVNPLNPTGLTVIRKKTVAPASQYTLACPITHMPLQQIKDSYFCESSLLAYPIIDSVPCLTADNAVVATHFTDEFSKLV